MSSTLPPPIEQSEMVGADVPAARSSEPCPSALGHVDAHVVDERTGDFPRSADADVAARVPSCAARSVRHEQVVPTIMKDDHRGFGVDRDVASMVLSAFSAGIVFVTQDSACVSVTSSHSSAIWRAASGSRVQHQHVTQPRPGREQRASLCPCRREIAAVPSHLNSRGANSLKARRHVSHSCAVSGDSK